MRTNRCLKFLLFNSYTHSALKSLASDGSMNLIVAGKAGQTHQGLWPWQWPGPSAPGPRRRHSVRPNRSAPRRSCHASKQAEERFSTGISAWPHLRGNWSLPPSKIINEHLFLKDRNLPDFILFLSSCFCCWYHQHSCWFDFTPSNDRWGY